MKRSPARVARIRASVTSAALCGSVASQRKALLQPRQHRAHLLFAFFRLKVMQALREVVAALGRRTHDAIEAEVDRGDDALGGASSARSRRGLRRRSPRLLHNGVSP